MASAGTAPATTGTAITIDVTKDLDSLSDLKNLISSQGKAIFTLADQLSQYAGQPMAPV